MFEAMFWFFLGAISYCYFIYPLFLFVIANISPRPVSKAGFEPTVSVVISVCNEEDVIEEKTKNLLSLDYPSDKMEVIIGSDGSSDNTNALIKNIRDPRIHLIESSVRRGKIATLNDIIHHATGEVVVFTDARQNFAPNAIRELVNNFNDSNVGCVSGELIFSKEKGTTGKGINFYWSYEKFIRKMESHVHSMIGATGAIYAIRRKLYMPAPADTVLDDVFIPLKIIEKGYRAVFDESAHAYDQVAESPKEEYRRKTRTLYGNYQIFTMFPALFNPFKSPIAMQIFSHKLLRVLIPFFMIGVFILNLFILSEKTYLMLFYFQVIFYAAAITGALLRYAKHGILKAVSQVCSIPYVFCLLNFSALVGFFKFMTAKQEITWQKAREK